MAARQTKTPTVTLTNIPYTKTLVGCELTPVNQIHFLTDSHYHMKCDDPSCLAGHRPAAISNIMTLSFSILPATPIFFIQLHLKVFSFTVLLREKPFVEKKFFLAAPLVISCFKFTPHRQ